MSGWNISQPDMGAFRRWWVPSAAKHPENRWQWSVELCTLAYRLRFVPSVQSHVGRMATEAHRSIYRCAAREWESVRNKAPAHRKLSSQSGREQPHLKKATARCLFVLYVELFSTCLAFYLLACLVFTRKYAKISTVYFIILTWFFLPGRYAMSQHC